MTSHTLTLSGVSLLATVGFFSGVGIGDVTKQAITPPPPRAMALVTLDYKDGEIFEMHDVVNGPIIAEWSAKIVRGDEILCTGGGVAPYEGGVLRKFTVNEWVGERCPKVRKGDMARATWEYRNEQGAVVSISGEILINKGL